VAAYGSRFEAELIEALAVAEEAERLQKAAS
jgi:hypothetical protein